MPDSQDETAIALLIAARKLESETDDFGVPRLPNRRPGALARVFLPMRNS